MKAAVIPKLGPPEVFELQDMDPPKPGPGEVLVSVAACGLCYHDIVTRDGTQRRHVKLPLIPGHEIAGTVVETGPEVHRIGVGARVVAKQTQSCHDCALCLGGNETLCSQMRPNEGGNAEFVVLRESAVVELPETIPFTQGAIISCAIGVGYHALLRAGLRMGETALVTGAGGGVGLHTVQLAAQAGARVIAQTGRDWKRDKILEMGADEVIVAPDLDFAGEVRELTQGVGADVVFENVGAVAFEAAWRSLARCGRFAVIGATDSSQLHINPGRLFMKGATLFGSTSTNRAELEELIQLVEMGRLTPVVSETMPLEEVASAHHLMEDRGILGRLVLTI